MSVWGLSYRASSYCGSLRVDVGDANQYTDAVNRRNGVPVKFNPR